MLSPFRRTAPALSFCLVCWRGVPSCPLGHRQPCNHWFALRQHVRHRALARGTSIVSGARRAVTALVGRQMGVSTAACCDLPPGWRRTAAPANKGSCCTLSWWQTSVLFGRASRTRRVTGGERAAAVSSCTIPLASTAASRAPSFNATLRQARAYVSGNLNTPPPTGGVPHTLDTQYEVSRCMHKRACIGREFQI